VCAKERLRERKDGVRTKEREAGRQNERERGSYTHIERVCVISDTVRKTDDRLVTAERESEGMHWRESKIERGRWSQRDIRKRRARDTHIDSDRV